MKAYCDELFDEQCNSKRYEYLLTLPKKHHNHLANKNFGILFPWSLSILMNVLLVHLII
jgi:hypothetical protein